MEASNIRPCQGKTIQTPRAAIIKSQSDPLGSEKDRETGNERVRERESAFCHLTELILLRKISEQGR